MVVKAVDAEVEAEVEETVEEEEEIADLAVGTVSSKVKVSLIKGTLNSKVKAEEDLQNRANKKEPKENDDRLTSAAINLLEQGEDVAGEDKSYRKYFRHEF